MGFDISSCFELIFAISPSLILLKYSSNFSLYYYIEYPVILISLVQDLMRTIDNELYSVYSDIL